MFKAFFSAALKQGWRGAGLAGIISFAASFGALNVFAAGWAAAVAPTFPNWYSTPVSLRSLPSLQ